MASLTSTYSLLLILLAVVCISLIPLPSAGALRFARSPSAQEEYRRQRQLTAIERGVRPPRRLRAFESSSPPIKYRGGTVMTGNPSINVYLIYYGSWPEGSGQNIIENFIQSLSADSGQQGSPEDPQVKLWWAISAAYTEEVNGTKTNISSKVRLAGTVYDDYSAGTDFGNNTLWEVVYNKIGDGKPFPYDFDGIYLLLSSKDVTLPDFCTKFAGGHSMGVLIDDSAPVVFAFVGHPGLCNHWQPWIRNPSPNGNPEIDFMISIIAHEIAEAATDPDLETGWADENRDEVGDKCHNNFIDTKPGQDSSGGTYEYNLVGMNNTRFLVQSIWDWEKNMCMMQRNYP